MCTFENEQSVIGRESIVSFTHEQRASICVLSLRNGRNFALHKQEHGSAA